MTLGHPPPPTGLESSRRKAIAVGNQQDRQGSKPSLAKDKAGSVSLNSQGVRVGAEIQKRAPHPSPYLAPIRFLLLGSATHRLLSPCTIYCPFFLGL